MFSRTQRDDGGLDRAVMPRLTGPSHFQIIAHWAACRKPGSVRQDGFLTRSHEGGSGWPVTCWIFKKSTRRRSRSLAARARTWGSFPEAKAFACRLAIV